MTTVSSSFLDALRKVGSEQPDLLASILDGADDIVYVKDVEGRYVLMNRAGIEALGIEIDDVPGTVDEDLFDPETAQRIRADDRKVVESKSRMQFSGQATVGGSLRHYSVTKWPWTDASGQVLGVIGISRDVTDRVQAEQALRDSEHRFRILFEQAPEAIVLFDPEQQRFVDANSNAEAFFGLSRDELLKIGPIEMSPPHQPDGRSSADAARELIVATDAGATPMFDWVHRNAAGEDVPCQIRLVRLPGGKIIRGSVTDVSERRKSEQEILRREAELRASEERYRTLVEQSLVGIMIIQDSKVVFSNPTMAGTLGYTPEEVASFTREQARDLLYPEDREEIRRTIRESLVGGRAPAMRTFRVVRKDGSVRWLAAYASVLELGGSPAILCATVDITGQREAEDALKQSEERHRTLLRALPDTVFVLDGDGCTTEVHAEGRSDLAHPRDSLIGQRFIDLLPEEVRAKAEAAIAATSKGGTSTFEYEQEMADDETTVYEARVASAAGERTVIVARDMTQRQILESQLRQAQKMEAVGQLAGGIAHDFNNLLTVIIGNAELGLLQSEESETAHAMLEQILQAAQQASGLTSQLLAFSRKQLVKLEPLDLNLVVSNSESMLRHLIEEDYRLTTRFDDDIGPVLADRAQLEQVLVNLAVNARDAMSPGGELLIATEAVSLAQLPAEVPPGHYVALIVQDNGAGISEHDQKHLFEPFFTTKPMGQGTGLGLATSYGIVERHGGHITVDSAIGRGTTVTVYLARSDEPPPPQPEPSDQLPRSGRETILLAEDDDEVRAMVVRVLSRLGYNVLDARDGLEAIQLLGMEKGPVDLLLTDVVMPGMSGRELSERVRAIRPGIKVLFASGYTDDVILERQLIEEGIDLIRKPYRLRELARQLRTMLDG